MSDHRLRTSRWQRLAKATIARAHGICEVQGPRCEQIATSVDHIVPVSQGGAFWSSTNLRAACRKCNYGQGSKIAADNRRARTAELHRIIQSQQARIDELTAALAAATTNPTPKTAGNRQRPAIR